MTTFKVRVACDLYGSKHNAMFLFRPPPTTLGEVIQEAERFYKVEAEKRRPPGHPGPAFQIAALQMYTPNGQWVDVNSVAQLTDGCQLYAFQQQTAWHTDTHGTIPEPVTVHPKPQLNLKDSSREQVAFYHLDTKCDGVIDSEEMMAALQSLQLRFTGSQIHDLFIVADEDGDGVISPEEFARFASRFPTVIDALHSKYVDDTVTAEGQALLQEAQDLLNKEREKERALLDQAASARRKVEELELQLAERISAHEAAMQRRPLVEAQQAHLVEQELALVAQKERLRQAQEGLRRDIQQTARGGLAGFASTTNEPQQQIDERGPSPVGELSRQMSVSSSRTSSFFLPSETNEVQNSAAAGGLPPVHDSLPPTPTARGMEIGTEVEATNFETKPEFNGLRGKVVAFKEDGKIAVEFYIRGGLTLDMSPNNIRMASYSNPALPVGSDIEAVGFGISSFQPSPIDLRGSRGRVVGYRQGSVLCEFPTRPGIYEVKPENVHLLSSVAPPSIHSAVMAEVQKAASGGQQGRASSQPVPTSPHPEVEEALREVDRLRKELQAERTKKAGEGRISIEASAALQRLGGLAPPIDRTTSLSPLAVSAVHSSPFRTGSPLGKASPLNRPSSLYPTATRSASPRLDVGRTDLWAPSTRGVSPTRRPGTSSPLVSSALGAPLPSATPSQTLQDILNKAKQPPAPASPATGKTPYSLGPIDPTML